jgi:hypothetical protein
VDPSKSARCGRHAPASLRTRAMGGERPSQSGASGGGRERVAGRVVRTVPDEVRTVAVADADEDGCGCG